MQANGASKPEVEGRISKAAMVFGKLKPLWREAACSTVWKLRVFNAVVLTVLFYSLESIVLTKALKSRIDYFHIKCLRNILGIDAAYHSRVSNQEVLNRASRLLYETEGKYKIASKVITERAVTLLGHIIRAEEEGQMKKIAFDQDFKRIEGEKRRVGRPRFYWLQKTMEKHTIWPGRKRGRERSGSRSTS